MKTIQAIKATKNTEIGTIKRVKEMEADSEVKSGYWKYVPKSEWKLETRKSKSTDQVSDQVTDQVEKKPYKKGSKPEKKNEKNN